MDNLTFISKLIEFLAWPLTVVAALCILRKQISSLIEKIKRANISGTEFEFAAQPSQEPTKTAGSISSLNLPDPVGLLREFEEPIYKDLDKASFSSADEKVKVLVTHLAWTQLNAYYERINSTIFGSQISLLNGLNSAPFSASLEVVKNFYDAAAEKYPEFYKNYAFNDYLTYLTRNMLMAPNVAGYEITKFGKGYLIFIAERGLTGYRHH